MSSTIKYIPFDTTLGYPQKQCIKIGSSTYTCYYRRNPEDGGFTVLKIVRDHDVATCFNGRLTLLCPFEVKDPDTYEVIFRIYPYTVTETACEVWLFV